MRPFTKIVPYYDQLMSHVRYQIWVDYTKDILRKSGIKGKKVIDLACGSGEPTRYLIRSGFDVTGLDNSPDMLDYARSKLPDVRFIEADLRSFHFDEKFDIAVSYYDSINYLLNRKDLTTCFQSVYNVLHDGGVFIFDMNTIHVLRDHWDNRIVVRENGNIFSIWENGHDPASNISTLKLTLFVREGKKYSRLREIHKERGYENDEVLKLLYDTGFRTNKVFHHLTFNPPSKDTDRVMFVASK